MSGEPSPVEVSFAQRVLARTLDGLVVGILTIPLRAAVPGALGVLLSVGTLLVYEGLMTHLFSATFGKLVMGTRIRNISGTPVSGLRAAVRFGVVCLGAVAAVVLHVPALAAAWVVIVGLPAMVGPKHRGIHDHFATTTVMVNSEPLTT